jgi:hypothetical protein
MVHFNSTLSCIIDELSIVNELGVFVLLGDTHGVY